MHEKAARIIQAAFLFSKQNFPEVSLFVLICVHLRIQWFYCL